MIRILASLLLATVAHAATPEVYVRLLNSPPSEGSELAGDETSQKVVVFSSTQATVNVYFALTDNAGQGEAWKARLLTPAGRDANGQWIQVRNGRGGFSIEAIEDRGPVAGSIDFAILDAPGGEYTVGSPSSVSVLIDDNDLTLPLAPSGLVLSSPSNNAVRVAWTDNSDNEDTFRVYRSTDDANWTPIADDSASPYDDTGLDLGTYYYRVAAVNIAGERSAASASISITIDPPSAPTGVAATPLGPSSVRVTWSDVAAETQYAILRDGTPIATNTVNQVSYTDTGLTANTTYAYTVRADNAGGSATSSPAVNATTHPSTIAAPTGLVFDQLTLSGFRATWTDNSSIEESFKVQISTASDYSGATETVKAANSTNHTFSGLSAGVIYYVRVAAYTESPSTLQSTWLEGSLATPPDLPSAPEDVAATVTSDDSLLITWRAATGATSYRVEEQVSGGSFAIVSDTVTATQLARTGRAAGTTYGYRVSARNGSGLSPTSSVASVTMPTTPPPPAPANNEIYVLDTDSMPWSAINAALASGDVIVYLDEDGSWGSGNTALDVTSKATTSNRLTFDGRAKNWTGSAWTDSGVPSTQRGGNTIQRVRMQNSGHVKYSNVTFRGLTISCNTGAKGVSLTGDNLILEYCDISHTSAATNGALCELIPTADGSNSGDEGSNSYSPSCDNVIIRHCNIHDGYGELLYIGGGAVSTGYPSHTRVLVEHNTFWNGGRWGGEGDAIDIKGGLSGVIVRYNEIHTITDSGARGIVTQGHAGSSAVYWAEHPGIKLAIYGNTIRDCVFTTRGAIDLNGGSWAQPTGSTLCYNNLIHDIAGSPAHGIVHDESHSGTLFVANNTIARCAGQGIRLGSTAASAATVINNALLGNNSSGNQVSLGATPPTYSHTAYGGSLSPAGSNAVTLTTGDFEDYAGDNFDIDSGSALYNAGTADSRITVDIVGAARVGNPDIGAYEGQVTTDPDPDPPPLPPPTTGGGDYNKFVTATANGTGNGSASSPWTMYQAWSQASPGDVIGYADGVYTLNFSGPSRAGTASNPIIHRSINWRGAKLQWAGGIRPEFVGVPSQANREADPGMRILQGADYNWLWGFDIYCTGTKRQHTYTSSDFKLSNPPYWAIDVGAGIYNYAHGTKIIHCYIHDTANGIGHWGTSSRARDCEYYGNIIINCGTDGTDREHHHGFYGQNGTGTVTLENNLFLGQAESNWQFYGTGASVLRNIVARNNSAAYDEVYFAPNGSPLDNLTHVDNVHFDGQVRYGYEWGNNADETPQNNNWTMQRNWFVQAATSGDTESIAFQFRYLPDAAGFVFRDNRVVRYSGAEFRMLDAHLAYGGSWPFSNWTVSGNQFLGDVNINLVGSGGDRSLSNWNTQYGANDTSGSIPGSAQVFVRPSKFEANRGHVTILNFPESSSVAADCSSFLEVGQNWLAYDAHNLDRGAVASGTGQTVTLPFSGRTRVQPTNFNQGTAIHWQVPAVSPKFGAWIVTGL